MHILIRHWKGVVFGIVFGLAAAFLLQSIRAGSLIGVIAGLRYSPALRAGEGKMIGLAVGGQIGLLLYVSSYSPGVSTPISNDLIQSSIAPGDFTLVLNGLFVGVILGGIAERFFLSLRYTVYVRCADSSIRLFPIRPSCPWRRDWLFERGSLRSTFQRRIERIGRSGSVRGKK